MSWIVARLERLLCVKALWALLVILAAGISLVPDEAQYWTWSHSLDWGYYSKPPGIAWQIYLTTQLFGDSELGVRSSALLLNQGLILAVYALVRSAGLTVRAATVAAAMMGFSIMGLLGSFLATTDGGLVLFWTLASIPLAKALRDGAQPNYALMGVLIGLGALWKWPIYLIYLPVCLGLLSYPHWRGKNVFLGLLLSFVGLLPSIYWNFQHDWVTFKHVWGQISGGPGGAHAKAAANPLDFFGAQIALLSPPFFVLGLWCFGRFQLRQEKLPPAIRGLALLSVGILLAYMGLACFQKMQGNWAVFAYPGIAVSLGWVAVDRKQVTERMLHKALALSLVLGSALMLLPRWQQSRWPCPSYSLSPFRHAMGWERLSEVLDVAGWEPGDFLAGHQYQMASLLSFYGPREERAQLLNVCGARRSQFSYWPALEAGRSGYLLIAGQGDRFYRGLDERLESYRQAIVPYFEEVRCIAFEPLFYCGGREVKGVAVYHCSGYLGRHPEDPIAY
jgi:4-amino-4-deoxy-L-arabinose transferase-like glycosyltransferase